MTTAQTPTPELTPLEKAENRRKNWQPRREPNRWDRFIGRRTRLTIEITLLVLAVGLLYVWFAAPYWTRDYINKGLSGLPDYTGRVERVRIHPITASIDVYDFHIDKKGGDIPVHFFYSPRWHVSLQWSQLIHGVTRASVHIFNPQVNLVNGPSTGKTQVGISGVWIDAIKAIIPWRVNQLRVIEGDVHFLDFSADPKVDLELSHLNVAAENMSNSKELKVPLPATVKITANPLLTGAFEMNMAINFDEQFATFTQTFKMEHVPAVGANSALQQYLKVRVKSGQIGLYSELAGDKGVYHGYVKPFFADLEFEPKPSDQGNVGAVWSGVLNTVKGLFENDNHEIATQAPISGRVDDPKVNTWAAIGGVLWNAYIEALKPGFDPTKSPPKPTDTVSAPKTESTQAATQKPSPAEKKDIDTVKKEAVEKGKMKPSELNKK